MVAAAKGTYSARRLVISALMAHALSNRQRYSSTDRYPDVGIDGLTPHGLRHTFASLAISAGANVKVVQRLLGHSTAAMTLDLYDHLFDDDLAGVADALGKAINATAVSRAE